MCGLDLGVLNPFSAQARDDLATASWALLSVAPGMMSSSVANITISACLLALLHFERNWSTPLFVTIVNKPIPTARYDRRIRHIFFAPSTDCHGQIMGLPEDTLQVPEEIFRLWEESGREEKQATFKYAKH